jgi:protein arginine kinase
VIEELLHQSARWLSGEGPEAEVVLSSRVRLARNLTRYPFVHRAKIDQLRRIGTTVKSSLRKIGYLKGASLIELHSLEPLDRFFLAERHLISHDLIKHTRERILLLSKNEDITIIVNEEDHLRLQGFASGLDLYKAYGSIDQVDSGLEAELDYAFSDSFGYLTACPTNVGTGMRASVLLHLPALVLTKEIDKILRAVSQLGISVRGLYGEGTEVKGNFFQISNQITLGKKEEDILAELEKIVKDIITYENGARETLLRDARAFIEDKIFRSYGIIKNARILTSDEIINLFSAVRLGIGLGLLDSVGISTLNELLIFTQPAHLQRLFGKEMKPDERDIARANYVRERVL